tara:strand:+ start:162 stop:644 length:483 start_codon:yes stop_codon:yes gene_type:complete
MADLTVTITEAVTLNGSSRGSTNTLTVTGVDDIYHRIITCPDDVPVTVANFHANTGTSDSSLDVENVKYIRITNMDGSNPVIVDLQIDAAENDSAAADNCAMLLEAGKSFIMGSPSDGIVVNSEGATPITALSSLVNLESIIVDPLSEAVQVEVFIASVV